MHTLKWFRNRRGKTIYRRPIKTEKGGKCCDRCEQIEVKVSPPKKDMPDHAQYLFDCERELGIKYFDRPVDMGSPVDKGLVKVGLKE